MDGAKAGMSPIAGRSFANLLRGESDPSRRFVILGRERNDVRARPGTPSGLGYPVRAIREGDLLYIHNFAPDRWPCGNPELGLMDTDASPTKAFLFAELRKQADPRLFGKGGVLDNYDSPKAKTIMRGNAAVLPERGNSQDGLFNTEEFVRMAGGKIENKQETRTKNV